MNHLMFLTFVLSAVVLSACGGQAAHKNTESTSSSSFRSIVSSSVVVSSLTLKSSSSAAASSTSVAVDVKTAMGKVDSRLACYKGTGETACNLRLYEVMVEAFVNGDDSININVGYGPSNHKGDLQGVINSLDYIKSLGINTLWLTPVFDSSDSGSPIALDATGYFPSNFFNTEKYFGTKDKLKELIDKAHEKGLYVLMDGVFGHVKPGAANYTNASPEGKRLIGGNDPLPYPSNLEFFKEVAIYWVTNYRIDGWRLDQAYQIPVQYWNEIRTAVENASKNVTYVNALGHSVNPLGYMVGELWKGSSEITAQGYGLSGSPALLSAFDFPMRYSVVQTLAVEEDYANSGVGKKPATWLNEGYKSHADYPDYAMPNLMLDNHDVVRFGDLIQRGNLANPGDDQYWGRHKAALSFMAAYSGPITLYYGDEIGQEVPNFSTRVDNSVCLSQNFCDDHVSRGQGIVEGVNASLSARQSNLKEYVASLMNLRDAHPALWNGSRTHIYSNANVYMDRKERGSDQILYALNITNAEVRINVAATAIESDGDLIDLLKPSTVYANTNGVYYLVLAPFEGAFLKISH